MICWYFSSRLKLLSFTLCLLAFTHCKNNSGIGSSPVNEALRKDSDSKITSQEQAVVTEIDKNRKQQVIDSMLMATNKKHFAYQISSKLKQEEAFSSYKKLSAHGIPSLYIFHVSESENYIVQYEGMSEGELNLNLCILQNKLDKNENRSVKIINLSDSTFCSNKKQIVKKNKNNKGTEINYIICI